MISIENITKTYSQHKILENASMEIPDGKIIGIYGKSGIGKSTIAKILCGVLEAEQGSIYMDKELLYTAGGRYNRRLGIKIQMVYQQPYSSLDYNQKLIKGFYELIRYHKFAKDKREADILINNLLEEVGLEREILAHRPYQISGGEAQRISIARSLLFHPRLLILDEATSMLDVSTQANVMALVRKVMEKSKGSVLLISHDKELVNYLCNQIYVFDKYQLKRKETKV
ncbi:MAG: dipeptide/oligopeptide/nickel ABC transporter ATP-binding protein [Bacillota bacterium]|nr:dipeptide/oligopeptide/nickel ABC transporter ATP-binding protein [Bacillota bacterium]